VIIDKHEDRAYVLTCWHIFADGAAGRVRVAFHAAGLRTWPGRGGGAALGRSDARSRRTSPAVSSATAETSPRVGDVVFVGGYGSGQWRWHGGRVRQYLSPGGGAAFDMIDGFSSGA
jgi:hypothetical protein